MSFESENLHLKLNALFPSEGVFPFYTRSLEFGLFICSIPWKKYYFHSQSFPLLQKELLYSLHFRIQWYNIFWSGEVFAYFAFLIICVGRHGMKRDFPFVFLARFTRCWKLLEWQFRYIGIFGYVTREKRSWIFWLIFSEAQTLPIVYKCKKYHIWRNHKSFFISDEFLFSKQGLYS